MLEHLTVSLHIDIKEMRKHFFDVSCIGTVLYLSIISVLMSLTMYSVTCKSFLIKNDCFGFSMSFNRIISWIKMLSVFGFQGTNFLTALAVSRDQKIF